MARTSQIIKALEEYAPLELAESWDNSGWQIFYGNDNTSKVLVCLSVTDDVVMQAIELGCNLIISHHPVIFNPLKVIKDAKIINAIQRGIQIYSLHTNCDKTNYGTSDLMAMKLNLKKVAILNDFVRVGLAPQELRLDELVSLLKLSFNVEKIKFVNNGNKSIIKTIAVCAGSGASFIPEIEKYNIDAYVTSEIKYHDALDSKRVALFDIGHFESEKPFVEQIKYILESQKEKVDVIIANEKPAWDYV